MTHRHILCCFLAACEEIFKIASMAPGALLLEAHKEYEVRILNIDISLIEMTSIIDDHLVLEVICNIRACVCVCLCV